MSGKGWEVHIYFFPRCLLPFGHPAGFAGLRLEENKSVTFFHGLTDEQLQQAQVSASPER